MVSSMNQIKSYWNRLGFRFTILFVFLAILPMVVVGVQAYFTASAALEQDVINRLATITLLKESEFNRWNNNNQELLRLLAQRPLVREYATALVLLDERDNIEFEGLRRNLLQDHLQPTLDVESSYIDLALIRARDGLVLVSTDETLEGKYRESDDFFIQGKLDTFVQHPVYHLGEEKAIMHISTPVTDNDGRVVMVLSGHVDLNEMSKIQTRRSNFSASEETYIVNHSNLLITETRFETGAALRKSIFTQGVTSCLAGNDGFGFYDDYRGIPVVGYYRWMAEENLCLLTEEDQAEAFLAVEQLFATTLFTIIVAVIVSVGLGLLTTRSITRPLQELEQRAASLATSLYEPLPTEEMGRFEEIVSLNQSFDQMASEIHERDRHLEEQVLARTAEVQEKAKELELANEFLQQHTWDLTLVNEVNSSLLQGDSLDEIIDVFAEKTREMYAPSKDKGAAILLLSDDGDQLILKNKPVNKELDQRIQKLFGAKDPEIRIPLHSDNLHQQVIQSGEPRLFTQSDEIDMWFRDFINETWIKQPWLLNQARKLAPQIRKIIGDNCIAAIPLTVESEPIGLIEISAETPLTKEDVQRLKIIANQLAVSIQRTRHEEEIHALREFNESIVQTVPGAIMAQDPNGYFTFVNPEAVNLLGYQPDELIGKHWKLLTPTDQHEIIFAADERRSQGIVDSYEIELEHKNGQRLPVIIKGSPRFDSFSGEFSGSLVILTDISQIRQAEEAILKEKNFSDDMINSLPGIFCLFDVDGKFIHWNQNFLEITGYTAEEMKRAHPNDFIVAEDQIKSQEAIINGFAEGRVYLEARFKTKYGPTPYYFVGSRTLIEGEPHLMGTAIDISDRVMAEETLKQRTVELERSNQDLERFAYIASHDLQEPLRKVQAFGDRLRSKYEDKLDERGIDYLLRMQETARRGQEMVEDLLTYSRVSTRGQKFESVNLTQVVNKVIEELKTSIDLTDALVSVGILPTINADANQVHQLLHHLLDNALKFHRPDTPPVIRINVDEGDSNQVVLSVCDNGIGFDVQFLEKVFQPFQRLHGRHDYPGTGIGLAICQKIVERHGGSISASSIPEKGSIFTITIPIRNENKRGVIFND